MSLSFQMIEFKHDNEQSECLKMLKYMMEYT
jgi:hypothetical protein